VVEWNKVEKINNEQKAINRKTNTKGTIFNNGIGVNL
jgi:hypothetical protein